MTRNMPGLPVHHQLPEFIQTQVHRVNDAIQPSHPLSSPSPPAPNHSQHQSLFQWVNSSHEIKLLTSAGSWKKQKSSRKTSISALLTMPKPLTVWITINWKILKEMGIPDHLTCLLRNIYAGQEATVRTGHGTTDWFQIGKGVHQGCILSPCLFNL